MSYGHWVTLHPPADVFFALPTIAVLHKGAKHKDICLQGGFILTLEGPRKTLKPPQCICGVMVHLQYTIMIIVSV